MAKWLARNLNEILSQAPLILTAALPIVTVLAAIGAMRAAWQHRRDRAAVLGAIALVGFSATILSALAMGGS